MSLLIKGMEMPTEVPILFCIHPDGKVFADFEGGWREYKAIPVPPHGRLIDADALAKRIKDEGRNQAEYYADRYAPVVMAYGDCYGKVQSAPTIIPAEEE